jgi:putative membrane protein
VVRVESGSAVEVVVALRPCSGSYDDVDMRWALAFALVTLLVVAYTNVDLNVHGAVLDVMIGATVGWFLSSRSVALRRLWTGAERRRVQVKQGAQLAFMQLGLSKTRERTALLVYCSLLENRAEILTDLGVEAKVPKALWNTLHHQLEACPNAPALEAAILAALDSIAEPLAAALPRPDDDVNELPDQVVYLK